MHILIAEDDFISRRLLKTYLEEMGCQVTATSNGAEAWESFDSAPTRLIVSDWLMPAVDGLEFCRRVRARPDTDYTYFIMLTANVGQEENYFQAMDAGVDDFLSKPLNRNELNVRLRVAERILKATSRIQSLESVLTPTPRKSISPKKAGRPSKNSWNATSASPSPTASTPTTTTASSNPRSKNSKPRASARARNQPARPAPAPRRAKQAPQAKARPRPGPDRSAEVPKHAPMLAPAA